MKRIISIFLCMALVLSVGLTFWGCTNTADLKYDIVLITDGADISDGSYNQSAWEAIQSSELTSMYYQPQLEDDTLSLEMIEDYIKIAADKGAKYIVLPGEKFAVAAYEVAPAYPDVNFILLDAFPRTADDATLRLVSNVMSVNYDALQSGFLAGYAAVLNGNSRLGYLGSVKSSSSSNYGAGYVQGAAYAADAMSVPTILEYADYDSPLLNYNYSFMVRPVYDKIENAGKDCFKIVVENGNGSGVYKKGENVTIFCDLYNAKGEKFDHWEYKSNTKGVKDKKVNLSSTKKSVVNLIVEKCDATITAVYKATDEKTASVKVLSLDSSVVPSYVGVVGETVWVTAPPALAGMVFDRWETSGDAKNIEDVNAKSTNITVEDSDVTLTPVYTSSEDPTFYVTVDNGTGTGAYLPGDEVHVVANQPNDGYYFVRWENFDQDGNLVGISMGNEFYYDTTFEMVDRYAAVAESMYDSGVSIMFAGGNSKSDSLYTAKWTFDYDAKVIGSSRTEKDAVASVVKNYGVGVSLCLDKFAGGSIVTANCSNKGIEMTYVTDDKELQKQYDTVYDALANDKIGLISVAPGADVRLSFSSSCLTLDYWIIEGIVD